MNGARDTGDNRATPLGMFPTDPPVVVMPLARLLAVASLVVVSSCGSSEKSEDSSEVAEAPATSGEPTWSECTTWLSAEPYTATDTVCQNSIERELEQLESDSPRAIPLASGRTAIVWLPEDWSDRANPSVLTVLHGTVGCAEAMFSDARWAFGDTHAVLALPHKLADGTFVDADAIYADYLDAIGQLEAACPTAGATQLLYGLSRGGLRAVLVAGYDRASEQRFSGTVSDSGTSPNGGLNPPTFDGARYLLWCGEYDPDPVQPERTTCEVMQSDMAPRLERGNAIVDDVIVGAGACHGMFTWDCESDCSACDGGVRPESVGPHAAEVGAWLEAVASGQ